MSDKQPPNLAVPEKLPQASVLHPSNSNSNAMRQPEPQPTSVSVTAPPAYFVPENVQPSFAPHPSSLTQPSSQQPQPQQFVHPSAPFAVPAPPPGSLDRAPGYNIEIEDEWCIIEKTAPAIPPNQMPVSVSVHHNGAPQAMSMTPHVPAPAMQPVGATQGSENLGYLYPTINQAALANTRASQALQAPSPFVVNPAPGSQVLSQPSVSSSQPFYPFGQQPTEALVTYAPFNITAEVANSYFVKWKEQLWFTPVDFGSKMCEAQLKPILMPYYIFDAGVFTSYSGEVGFVERTVTHQHQYNWNSNGGHSTTTHSTSVRWRKASGSKSGMYPGVLTIGSVVKEDYPKLHQIDGWHIDALITTPMSTDQLGPAVDWSTAFYSTPNGAFNMIIKSEEQDCASHLKRDNHADRTQHVHVNVGITSLSYRVVYLPIYFTVYSYQGKVFKVFINGQSGKIYGERPYGMGGIVNGLKTIGSLFKKKQKAELLSGTELQQRDNMSVYNPSSYFVVLPPSDRQLGVASVGFVTLENAGPNPVQLVAQKRLTTIQSGSVILPPHSTKSFDYIGDWVIELLGECSHVRIVEFATKGGAKGNDLYMKA